MAQAESAAVGKALSVAADSKGVLRQVRTQVGKDRNHHSETTEDLRAWMGRR